MGLAGGWLIEKKSGFGYKLLAVALMLVIKLAGYYIFEAIFYHNLIEPLASVPGNILQVVLAAVPVLVLITPLQRALKIKKSDI